MRRANWLIVCSYVIGIAAGERLLGLSSSFLVFSAAACCTAVALVLLHSYGRSALSGRAFNLLFSLCTFLCFLSLGGERALCCNELKTSAIEERIAEETDRVRERFGAFVDKVFASKEPEGAIAPATTASIAKALLVGEKSTLSRGVKQEFRDAGVAHTLALSGLHVGIVWSFLSLLLFFLNRSLKGRRIRVFIISALIFVYAFATGLSNSVVRAAIMLSLWQFNHIYGRKNSGVNSILTAGFLILLINPSSISSISFQLSFAAVLGIAIMYPVINESILFLSDALPVFSRKVSVGEVLNRKTCLNIVKSLIINYLIKPLGLGCKKVVIYSLRMMGISIACQIFTLPIILYYFGTTSQYFLLSNLAVIPGVTLTVYSSSLTLIATFLSDLAGNFGSGFGFGSLSALFEHIAAMLTSITSHVVDWLLQLVQFLAA